MRTINIDAVIGQTPCLCGAIDGWHRECYAGKDTEQVQEAYARVYAKIRRAFGKDRKAALLAALGAATDEENKK